jgi:DNA-binding response OmpR family regulator
MRASLNAKQGRMLDSSGGATLRFSVFEMDMRSGELRKRGVRVPLQQQPFRILVRLAERPGEIVTREAIRRSSGLPTRMSISSRVSTQP